MMNSRHSYCIGNLKTRNEESSQDKFIEGYFSVANQETELQTNLYEEIATGAFSNSLKNNDIRCLFNHDAALVLGRTTNNTLELKEDSHGLWGRVKINPNDKQAQDIYARVQRGDISGCSFGFNPIIEEIEERPDGTIKWKVLEADTLEVSICTFPAYPQTEIQARQKDINKGRLTRKKAELKKKLEGIKC